MGGGGEASRLIDVEKQTVSRDLGSLLLALWTEEKVSFPWIKRKCTFPFSSLLFMRLRGFIICFYIYLSLLFVGRF